MQSAHHITYQVVAKRNPVATIKTLKVFTHMSLLHTGGRKSFWFSATQFSTFTRRELILLKWLALCCSVKGLWPVSTPLSSSNNMTDTESPKYSGCRTSGEELCLPDRWKVACTVLISNIVLPGCFRFSGHFPHFPHFYFDESLGFHQINFILSRAIKGQHPRLSDEANTEVQKAAVHWVATWGWLQEGVNSHWLPC